MKETLGKGKFGLVKSAIHKKTGKRVVLKKCNKSRLIDLGKIEAINRESDIHHKLKHQNIAELHHTFMVSNESI